MIKWVRAYNLEHPDDKVSFVGFDMQSHYLPLDSLFTFLERQEPTLADSVEIWLEDLKQNGHNQFMVSIETKLAWFEQAQKSYEALLAKKMEWLKAAKTITDSFQIKWGIQYANLVKQFAENAFKGHLSFYRDEAMAENISWILSMHPPGTKMLVWAHDNHIARGDHPDNDLNFYFGLSMGRHLSKKYGDKYKAFGLSTYEGDYWAQISYFDFRQQPCPLYPGPIGSLDEALHQIALKKKSPALLLDLQEGRTQHWLSAPLPVRFANHVNIEYGYWTRYSIPYQFDGIFFVDKTSAAKSYARK